MLKRSDHYFRGLVIIIKDFTSLYSLPYNLLAFSHPLIQVIEVYRGRR